LRNAQSTFRTTQSRLRFVQTALHVIFPKKLFTQKLNKMGDFGSDPDFRLKKRK